MITIQDVAQHVGVSIATVSYVINQKGRVSPEVAARVQAAVKELHYVPSGAARKFRRRATGVVGFLADNIANRCPSHVVQGLAAAAAHEGYGVLISDLQGDSTSEPRALEMLVREQVEGLIYCGLGTVEEELLQLHRSGIPVVVVDKPPVTQALPSVLIDNAASTRLALEHLFALGHREIRCISGDPQNRNTRLRTEAFRRFLRQHRLPCPETHILPGAYSLQHGYTSAIRLLDEQPAVTAVFCGDDMIAFGAMAGFRARGRRIPDDIAVVGFMNDPLAGVVDPGLTSIQYPMQDMGRRAFETFLRVRKHPGRSAPQEYLPTTLVVRRSTDPTVAPFTSSELIPNSPNT